MEEFAEAEKEDILHSCTGLAEMKPERAMNSGYEPLSSKEKAFGHENIVFFDSRRIRHLERMIDLFHVLFRQ